MVKGMSLLYNDGSKTGLDMYSTRYLKEGKKVKHRCKGSVVFNLLRELPKAELKGHIVLKKLMDLQGGKTLSDDEAHKVLQRLYTYRAVLKRMEAEVIERSEVALSAKDKSKLNDNIRMDNEEEKMPSKVSVTQPGECSRSCKLHLY